MSDTPIFDSEFDKHANHEETETGNTRPQPKVVAATVGAGVGSAAATVIVWVVGLATAVAVPEAVELAIGVILTAGLAFIGGYWKRG